VGRKMAAEALGLVLATLAASAAAETTTLVPIRGHSLKLRVSGPDSGAPVIVASGDGGWIHLGPDVAARLAATGYFVVGLDSKAYLSSFTEGKQTLGPEDVPNDFAALADYARRGREERVLLVGVSEGAGLAVLAASDPALQARLLGVIALGLPRVNELAWRFKDSLIYLTHKTPNEPTFDSGNYIAKLGPVPLAALHSTHDEFVPLAEAQALLQIPGGTKRLWVIEASNHRFSDDRGEFGRRLSEALAWVRAERH